MILGLFRRKMPSDQVQQVYGTIVAQARLPVFYTDFGVEDTVTGRFDMIVLHAFLLFQRLSEEDQSSQDFGQKVFDAMFVDMDHSLREMGVGDISVPKKIKKMVQAFYGRCKAYGDALSEGADENALREAVLRNLLTDEQKTVEADALAAYIRSCLVDLKMQPVADIQSGTIRFIAPDEFAA